MIKTLKSELKLRPTYDELVGMIESQGDPNRPPIEKIIDRRATIFRNNQFGSQFDNVDFLGLKKQEEEKLKQEQRQTQLRQTAIATGTSVGMLNARQSGTSTPMSFDTAPSVGEFTNEEMDRMAMELQRYAQIQEERLRQSGARASTDLDEAHRQSLPVGVMDEDDDDDDVLAAVALLALAAVVRLHREGREGKEGGNAVAGDTTAPQVSAGYLCCSTALLTVTRS